MSLLGLCRNEIVFPRQRNVDFIYQITYYYHFIIILVCNFEFNFHFI